MNRRLVALGLCAAVLLTGCSSMLEREKVSTAIHPQFPTTADESDAIRVENYQQLVSALMTLVDGHRDTGVLRLSNYTVTAGHTVSEDLSRARNEVCHDDPLGSYAVEGMDATLEHNVMYYEATVTITYRRTRAQVDQVTDVIGSRAIRTQLCSALSGLQPELVLRANYFYEDIDYIQTLIRESYYDTPDALVLPEAEVRLYPETGIHRVIEVLFSYPDDSQTLRQENRTLLEAADLLLADLDAPALSGDALAGALFTALVERNAAHAAAEEPLTSTPYCLVSGVGDSLGLAKAYQLLCTRAGLECQVVEGTREDRPYFWTIVTFQGSSRHVDPTGDALLLTDDQFAEWTGAEWSREDYPACGENEEN